MLSNQHFYHSCIRSLVVAFGDLFNNITIKRRDADNGDVIQSMKVPLMYGPKEKYISTLFNAKKGVRITLPTMSFEITNITYDSTRKINTLQKYIIVDPDDESIHKYQFTSVPYNVGMTLALYCRSTTDGLQIVEQILPFFTPEFNVTINAIPALSIKRDIPIILNSVNVQDEYEHGQEPEGKKFIWTLDFTLRGQFYGNITEAGIITKTITHQYAQMDDAIDAEDPTSTTLSNAMSRITITPDPLTANADSDYGFTTEYLVKDESI